LELKATRVDSPEPRSLEQRRTQESTRSGFRAWHWRLARGSLSDPIEISYYTCSRVRRTTLTEVAAVAGPRRRVKQRFQQAKNKAGLVLRFFGTLSEQNPYIA
jgi:hypothetical protein